MANAPQASELSFVPRMPRMRGFFLNTDFSDNKNYCIAPLTVLFKQINMHDCLQSYMFHRLHCIILQIWHTAFGGINQTYHSISLCSCYWLFEINYTSFAALSGGGWTQIAHSRRRLHLRRNYSLREILLTFLLFSFFNLTSNTFVLLILSVLRSFIIIFLLLNEKK
jgi:hypothetical protein